MNVEITFLSAVVFAVLFAAANAAKSTNFDERDEVNEEGDLSRLKTTEAVVQQFLERVEQLEARNKVQQQLNKDHIERIKNLEARENDQQQVILSLRTHLAVQRQRIVSLERLNARNDKPAAFLSEDKIKEINQAGNKPGEGLATTSEAFTNKTYGEDNKEGSGYDMHMVQAPRIRREENEETIAFFATLTNHLQHAGVQQTFVFDRVVTNIGNGYNNHNGNFVAPVSGTYVFSATLISLYHQSSHSQFTQNGQAVSYMYVSGTEAGYDTTSQTIVVKMQKGDDLCIRNIDADKSYLGAHYSTFSGFLLQQDYSLSTAVGKK